MTASFRKNVAWLRDENNPILPPGPGGAYGERICMNPCAVTEGDETRLYYARDMGGGGDRRGIYITRSQAGDPARWSPGEFVLPPGRPGSFDGAWCVLPNLIRMENGLWHLYYTGNSGSGSGLSQFPGIGLAVSEDGLHFRRYGDAPVLAPSGTPGSPDRIGVAGGSVLRVRLPDGGTQLRYYYTGCPTLGDDYFLDQQKSICLAVSRDGVEWEKLGPVLRRDPLRDYEDVAVAGPVVTREGALYRMWYSAIGTRWGYYSVCYAESRDGLSWRRGEGYGENLQLGPDLGPLSHGWREPRWDGQMAAYPSVLRKGDGLRLFYTGNGYGLGGIGTADASPLRAAGNGAELRICGGEGGGFTLTLPRAFACRDSPLPEPFSDTGWRGPDPDCTLWREWELREEGCRLNCRLTVRHRADGIGLAMTLVNPGGSPLRRLSFTQELLPADGNGELSLDYDPPLRTFDRQSRSGGLRLRVMLESLGPYETLTLRGRLHPAGTDSRR